jgi:two-component system chemotaxis response regulator CheB
MLYSSTINESVKETMTDEKVKDGVIAIGASAGGLNALQDLLKAIKKPLNAPMVIAIHSNERSILKEVLEIDCDLTIKSAQDRETIEKGVIYVAPGATHVFFKGDELSLSPVVRNSGFRPSIDALFMTLACAYRESAIGVILSGTMQDGMRGAQIIYDLGGQTIVQDPSEAMFPTMPKSIIVNDHPEAVLDAEKLGKWLHDNIGYLDT